MVQVGSLGHMTGGVFECGPECSVTETLGFPQPDWALGGIPELIAMGPHCVPSA